VDRYHYKRQESASVSATFPPILRSSGARNSYSICNCKGYPYPYSPLFILVYIPPFFCLLDSRSFNILNSSHHYKPVLCPRDKEGVRFLSGFNSDHLAFRATPGKKKNRWAKQILQQAATAARPQPYQGARQERPTATFPARGNSNGESTSEKFYQTDARLYNKIGTYCTVGGCMREPAKERAL